MSRPPTPDPGWETSTEGDLDDDLTEEAGSDLDDWAHEDRSWWSGAGVRAVAALLLFAILGAAVAQVVLR